MFALKLSAPNVEIRGCGDRGNEKGYDCKQNRYQKKIRTPPPLDPSLFARSLHSVVIAKEEEEEGERARKAKPEEVQAIDNEIKKACISCQVSPLRTMGTQLAIAAMATEGFKSQLTGEVFDSVQSPLPPLPFPFQACPIGTAIRPVHCMGGFFCPPIFFCSLPPSTLHRSVKTPQHTKTGIRPATVCSYY